MSVVSQTNVYGIGGMVAVGPPVLGGFGPPSANFKGQLGQSYFDKSTSPYVEYIWNGTSWEIGSSSSVNEFTADTGTAIPAAGNINILGSGPISTSASGSTVTITGSESGFPTTPFVVGPVGEAGYQTIQSALDAADAAGGGIVVVQPGSYTESLTLYDGVHIMGLDFSDAGGGVNITGVHTPPTTGGFVFNNVRLISATHIFDSAVAGSAHLVMANAEIFVTNGYTFNLPNWTGKLESFDVNGAVGTDDGYVNNTGGAEVDLFDCSVGAGSANPMIVSGFTIGAGANVYCPVNFTTGSSIEFDYSFFGNALTLANNSTGIFTTSHFSSGASAAITMSSSGAVSILTSAIVSSNNPAIDGAGAGTLTLGDITFGSNSSVSGTLTVVYATTRLGHSIVNGNLTFGTEGNKIISSNVATTITAGANSFGSVTLAGGTATVSTTSVTTNSLVFIWRQSIGATGAAATGNLTVGTIVNGTSFVINAVQAADATALQASDVSVIGWIIVN